MKRTKEDSETNEFGLPGIGMPAEILLHPELSSTEKLLFGLIKNLAHTENGCWATNNWLGGMLGVRGQTITNGVAKLEKYGFIKIQYSRRANGNQKRTIRINYGYQLTYHEMIQEAYKNINRGLLKNLYTHIKKLIPPYKNINTDKDIYKDNNKDNNNITENGRFLDSKQKESSQYKKRTLQEFDKFWEYYPRKVSKQPAKKRWEKIFISQPKKDRPTFNQVIEGLKNQLPILSRREPKYIPHASTWLGESRWEDNLKDIGGGSSRNGQSKPASGYRSKTVQYQEGEEI